MPGAVAEFSGMWFQLPLGSERHGSALSKGRASMAIRFWQRIGDFVMVFTVDPCYHYNRQSNMLIPLVNDQGHGIRREFQRGLEVSKHLPHQLEADFSETF